MRKTLALGLSCTIAVVLLACGSKKEPTAPQATADAATMTPILAPTDAGPTADAAADAAAADGGPAMMLNTDAVADTAIDLLLTTNATKVAPRMDKDGVTAHATVKEGEHFGLGVTLQPGRCYTIVGVTPPGGVTHLELTLQAVGLITTQAGHSAPGDAKTMPVIGKGSAPLCPVLPIAMPYKIDAVATKGAGRIGIQMYSRAK